LQPDGPHYHLSANIRLVASYQKNSTAARSPKPSAPAPANDATISAPAKPANIFGAPPRAQPIHPQRNHENISARTAAGPGRF
jgi:hypothetical protein